MFVKICGMTRQQDLDLASSLGANLCGFIFAQKSPRFITPGAAPSAGSVPAQSSSNSTRLSLSQTLRISTIFFVCDENVESDCSMDCSSPMSAKTCS